MTKLTDAFRLRPWTLKDQLVINFGDAPTKAEGQPMPYNDNKADDPNAVETTYIEFSLPVAWEKECWAMIDAWLKAKGSAPPAPAAPVQVSPLEFVTRVAGREEATGPPTLWTQWPTPKIDPNQWAFDHGLEST